jgi:cobalt/nickel transport system permease protein
MLGYFAFPAILIGLFFQALVIGHGGITTLGVNAAMMGIPAMLAYHIFQSRHTLAKVLTEPTRTGLFAFLGGTLGLGIAALIFLALIIFNIPAELDAGAERAAILALSIAHVPLALIEGLFTAMLVLFVRRVKPELLEG